MGSISLTIRVLFAAFIGVIAVKSHENHILATAPTTSNSSSIFKPVFHPRHAIKSRAANPSDSQDCCPVIYLSQETVKQATDDLCTKTCIDGLKIIGVNLFRDKPPTGWKNIQAHFDKVTLIKSHLELNGLFNFGFEFSALKTIEAEYVSLEGTEFAPDFLKSLEIVRPSKENCEMIVSITGFPAGAHLDRFNAAVAKGKQECLAKLPPKGDTKASGAGSAQSGGSSSGENATSAAVEANLSAVLLTVVAICLIGSSGANTVALEMTQGFDEDWSEGDDKVEDGKKEGEEVERVQKEDVGEAEGGVEAMKAEIFARSAQSVAI